MHDLLGRAYSYGVHLSVRALVVVVIADGWRCALSSLKYGSLASFRIE